MIITIISSDFFNVEFANKIQLPSLIFETVGFLLVILELFFINFAIKVESHIDEIYEKSKSLFLENIGYIINSLKNNLELILFNFMLLLIYCSISALTGKPISLLLLMLFLLLAISQFRIFYLSIFYLIIFIALIPILLIVKLANLNTNKNAIGGIGLILALLGLLGEYYQYFASF